MGSGTFQLNRNFSTANAANNTNSQTFAGGGKFVMSTFPTITKTPTYQEQIIVLDANGD